MAAEVLSAEVLLLVSQWVLMMTVERNHGVLTTHHLGDNSASGITTPMIDLAKRLAGESHPNRRPKHNTN